MDARQITLSALIKPRGINALDPTVLFSTFYTGLTYGIYYSFFECFPLVYNDMYGFNLGELGLSFLSVLCGLVVQWLYYAPTSTMYSLNVLANLIQSYQKHVSGLGCLQYLFAWIAGPSIHWMVSMVGIAINMCGVFVITQCMFIYLPFMYPHYAGSLFATNGFARSIFAAALILFSLPLFDGIQVSGGVTLLTSFSVACIFGMFALYFFGARVRKCSQFAG